MTDKYKVLMDFKEPEDKTAKGDQNIYRKDGPQNSYPRDGYTPTKERIDYLTSTKCMKGKGPVIEAVGMHSLSALDNKKG